MTKSSHYECIERLTAKDLEESTSKYDIWLTFVLGLYKSDLSFSCDQSSLLIDVVYKCPVHWLFFSNTTCVALDTFELPRKVY